MNRNTSIDAMKAFAIVCVVFGHCIQFGSGTEYCTSAMYYDNWLFRVIYSFHMPLFMMLSGYLFGHSVPSVPWYRPILKKTGTLLLPVFSWSLLFSSVLFFADMCSNSLLPLEQYGLGFLSMSSDLFWFLWAIFWCSLIVTAVNRFFNDSVYVYLAGFILTFFAPDKYNLFLYKFMYPYFVLGYLFYKGRFPSLKFTAHKYLIYLPLILYLVLIPLYNKESFIYTTWYGAWRKGHLEFHQLAIDLYRFATGLAGSLSVIALFQNILPASLKTNRMISLLGRNTLGIYVISGFLFRYCFPFISRHVDSFQIHITVIECAAVLVTSLLVNEGLKRSRVLGMLFLGRLSVSRPNRRNLP